MTINGSPEYETATAFRRALEDRLRRVAKERGRKQNELRREFLFQRFLALVFTHSDDDWILKGGASLLIRLDNARFSRDLDLLRLGKVSANDAIANLREVTRPGHGDYLTFVIGDVAKQSRANPVVEIGVTAYIGAEYDRFTVDLATELHFVSSPERLRPSRVVDVPGLPDVPEILLYPLTDQLADKVCAMYETHEPGNAPSSRFRDLADLVRIVDESSIDAGDALRSLRSEEVRRGISLPKSLVSPGASWTAGYSRVARDAGLDAGLRDLDAALAHVGLCVNPLLEGTRTVGTWEPGAGWRD